MPDLKSHRLAVLIDADNAQPMVAKEILSKAGRYGTATVRRAYGDWTTPNLNGWKGHLHQLAILPVQQFRFTSGKNSTDSAMIIDAMDLLHGGTVDGFCLVSSDSDFTRLATRIREAGLSVYGFGEKKTPTSFVAACNSFVFTDLKATSNQLSSVASDQPPLKPILIQAVADAAGDDGWALLGIVGSRVKQSHPEFDPRKYGKPKLSELVKCQSFLEVRKDPKNDGSRGDLLYVRAKVI
ncbi:NYN domain protein [Pirellula sp. SH-Sr6A]|uniref:NYN domain-containing protein n=1 Tax=Pirellula sp. SH-Sr6A TaxID=1632865 RepID=UPI00078C3874|nr:NYN domain-containing protein [Pirellula sp. SH-Sr6A]AMV33920.1 NYN domain protein [Pirellula sp. SH-Sr6A]